MKHRSTHAYPLARQDARCHDTRAIMRVFARVSAGIVGLVLIGVLKWAFDSFLWDWFVQFIEVRWHLKEATLIASVSSYVFPIFDRRGLYNGTLFSHTN
jgi:hypothetical protein